VAQLRGRQAGVAPREHGGGRRTEAGADLDPVLNEVAVVIPGQVEIGVRIRAVVGERGHLVLEASYRQYRVLTETANGDRQVRLIDKDLLREAIGVGCGWPAEENARQRMAAITGIVGGDQVAVELDIAGQIGVDAQMKIMQCVYIAERQVGGRARSPAIVV